MIQRGINTRVGPICRTVEDAARILDVIAGYDPKDELTAFSVGRMPDEAVLRRTHDEDDARRPAHRRRPRVHGQGRCSRSPTRRASTSSTRRSTICASSARRSSTRARGRAVPELRRQVRAEVAEPAVHPRLPGALPVRRAPARRPTDHIATLLDMFFDPSLVPHTATGRPSIRNLGGTGSGDTGDGKYNFNAVHPRARRREDPEPHRPDRQGELLDTTRSSRTGKSSLVRHRPRTTLATASALQTRFTLQTVVYALLRADGSRRGGLSVGQHPAGHPDLARGAVGQRPRPRLDGYQQPGLPGDDRPGGLHDAGLRPRATASCCRRFRRAARRDRLPRAAVQRADAVRDRRRLRGGDAQRIAPPDFPPVPQTAITARTSTVGGSVPGDALAQRLERRPSARSRRARRRTTRPPRRRPSSRRPATRRSRTPTPAAWPTAPSRCRRRSR